MKVCCALSHSLYKRAKKVVYATAEAKEELALSTSPASEKRHFGTLSPKYNVTESLKAAYAAVKYRTASILMEF